MLIMIPCAAAVADALRYFASDAPAESTPNQYEDISDLEGWAASKFKASMHSIADVTKWIQPTADAVNNIVTQGLAASGFL